MLWKKIDLEVSLKSFPEKETEKIVGVIRNLYRQWDQMVLALLGGNGNGVASGKASIAVAAV